MKGSVLILLFFPCLLLAETYYVSDHGSALNSGTSTANPWTMEHATRSVSPGDVIYVQAGTYSGKITFTISGTPEKPITWIGYRSTLNDIIWKTANGYSTFGQSWHPISEFNYRNINYSDSYNPSDYPTFSRNLEDITNKGSKGRSWNITADYNHYYNFQFTQVETAVVSSGDHCRFINLIAINIGDLEQDQKQTGYHGKAFSILGSNNVLDRCVVLNSAAVAFGIGGKNNTITGCLAINNKGEINGTDYYFLSRGNYKNHQQPAICNIWDNVVAIRAHDGAHGGHGFVMKHARDNKITNFRVFNTQVEMMFSSSTANVVENGEMYGRTRFALFNGAHGNVFRNIKMKTTQYKCITFGTQRIRGSMDQDLWDGQGPYNNLFENIVIQGGKKPISIGEDAVDNKDRNRPYRANYFYNCIWDGQTSKISSYVKMDEPYIFRNCSFINGTTSKSLVNAATRKNKAASVNFDMQYTHFFSNNYPDVPGNGNLSGDPLFKDPSSMDYTLKKGSPLKGAGAPLENTIRNGGKMRSASVKSDIGISNRR